MIGKGKSISHGVAALEYDLAKEIDGQAAATEIARHELYGCTGAEMVQEMKPYFTDFPNVKNNCLRFALFFMGALLREERFYHLFVIRGQQAVSAANRLAQAAARSDCRWLPAWKR